MTAPRDLTKINDLIEQPNKNMVQEIVVDDGAGGVPKRMTVKNLQRTQTAGTQDESGNPTANADFADYTFIQITADEDITITLSNVEDKEEVFLRVRKGANDVVTLSGILGLDVQRVSQYNVLDIVYRITTANTTTGDYPVAVPLITQKEGVVLEANFTPFSGTVTDLTYFDYTVINGTCFYEMLFVYTDTSYDTITITIANWDIDKYNAGVTVANISLEQAASPVLAYAKISGTVINIDIGSLLPMTGGCSVLINGHFKVN